MLLNAQNFEIRKIIKTSLEDFPYFAEIMRDAGISEENIAFTKELLYTNNIERCKVDKHKNTCDFTNDDSHYKIMNDRYSKYAQHFLFDDQKNLIGCNNKEALAIVMNFSVGPGCYLHHTRTFIEKLTELYENNEKGTIFDKHILFPCKKSTSEIPYGCKTIFDPYSQSENIEDKLFFKFD